MSESLSLEIGRNVEELRDRIGKDISLAAILSILGKYPCPDRCFHALSETERPTIDPFYSERHRYLQRLLIDRLRIKLTDAGIRARLAAEHDLGIGKGDVDVIVTPTGVELRTKAAVVRIELKTGSNFDLSQVIRYLVDVDAVVVSLCGRGQAVALKKSGTEEHISSLMGTYADKLQSLLKDHSERVQGPWCSGCPVDCPNKRPAFIHEVNFQTELQAPIGKWTAAIDDAISKTILLLKELSATFSEGGAVDS